jgi:hypothetical protein
MNVSTHLIIAIFHGDNVLKTGTARESISLKETQAQRPCEDSNITSSNGDRFDDLPQTATKKVDLDVISAENLVLHREWLLGDDYCTDSVFDLAYDLIQDNATAWRNARLVLASFSGKQVTFAAGRKKYCVTIGPKSMKYLSQEKFSVELECYVCKAFTNSKQIQERLNKLCSVSNDSNGPRANESESSSFEAALPALFSTVSDVSNVSDALSVNEVSTQYDKEFPAL